MKRNGTLILFVLFFLLLLPFFIAAGFEGEELNRAETEEIRLAQNIDYFSALMISKPKSEIMAMDFSLELFSKEDRGSGGFKSKGGFSAFFTKIARIFGIGKKDSAESSEVPLTNLSDFRGEVVFLNFWATWCGPCKAEVKDIDTLYDTLKNEDFTVMAVDIREDKNTIAAFMENYGIDFPVYLDTTGEVAAQYAVSGIPTTYIIDPDGRIIGRAVGPRAWGSKDSINFMRSLMK